MLFLQMQMTVGWSLPKVKQTHRLQRKADLPKNKVKGWRKHFCKYSSARSCCICPWDERHCIHFPTKVMCGSADVSKHLPKKSIPRTDLESQFLALDKNLSRSCACKSNASGQLLSQPSSPGGLLSTSCNISSASSHCICTILKTACIHQARAHESVRTG